MLPGAKPAFPRPGTPAKPPRNRLDPAVPVPSPFALVAALQVAICGASAGAGFAVLALQACDPIPPEPVKETVIYKRADGLDIKLDVHHRGAPEPTALVHGTADTDVPFEQSQLMAREFGKHGVEHELLAVAGAEHGLAGGDPAEADEACRKAFEFLKRHLLEP